MRRERHIVPGQKSLPLSQGIEIPIVWTACNLGGERPYFLCSNENCVKPRVLILYLSRGKPRLLCRKCLDLAYPSQRESDLGRAKRRAHEALQRLGVPSGEAGDFTGKPKNMHAKTFVKLGNEYLAARKHWEDVTRAFNESLRLRNEYHLNEIIKENEEERRLEALKQEYLLNEERFLNEGYFLNEDEPPSY